MTSKVKGSIRTSKLVNEIQPSGIRKFFDLASSMDNIISLGVGEPDFVTPWATREACISSLERGYTAYTANAGLLELRVEICEYMKKQFQLSYDPKNEIIVTVGASEALDIALRAIVDPGDEVIVVEPTFVSYAPLVTLAGGKSVSVGTTVETNFKLTPDQLQKAITPRTKAIMLSFPNNPTGATMTKEELEAIAQIVEEHNLIVLSDEIYAELSYDSKHASIANIEGMRERTIIISGFSKAFAMTGWRLGFVTGPSDIISAMLKIHQYTLMCAPTMAQYAAVEALQTGMEDVNKMVQSYKQRRNYFVKSFEEIGLPCHVPGGAFYAFPSIKDTGLTSEQFAEQLLISERVAVVPGHVFGSGGEGHIRCSYATSLDNLKEAVTRIGRFLEKL
ncbi:aromatic amino acid aminotransferase [Anaerobacillus alkalidiazotrophicus]|uniref:Aminotransferase n=1 Tax=Anaerobacillus alkalidiazotrophicus TaxID=472963 RepID=A0A1S2MEX8_9BACI|nr:aminotransferase [Anaerobacillus alkalidiazotrophicus]OIJ22245.1 aromatic amino acid aminotransferase [Anaerobacillus alkalidiazotrophicus]